MDLDIRDNIVGIVAKSGSGYKYSGTGFFVAGGLILICVYVVEREGSTLDIEGFKPVE